jgi:transposase
MLRAGCSVAEVASHFGRSSQAIRDLQKKYNTTGSTKDLPRSGRPSILSTHQKKIIYRKVHATPKIEYSELP